MTREEEFTHEGFVYANNIYIERKCELFEVKDIAHDFVQGAIYADQHPRKGLWDAEKVIDYIYHHTHVRTFGDIVIDDMSVTEFIETMKKAMEE